MSLIDRAKAHYKALTDEPKSIRVPEWDEERGEKPCIIYYTPLTLQQRKRAEQASGGQKHELAVEILIMKALDKEGKPQFSKADKPDIMRGVDAAVVERVTLEMVGASDSELVEEAEKN